MRKPVNISTFAAVKTFCLTLKTLKGMKKLMYLALVFIAIATGFTACQQKSTSISGIDNEFKLEEVAPFFYKVVYDKDYDFNAGRAMVNDLHMGKKSTFFSGGCTEVRHGNQVGRNLDWNVNYEAAAVQWMPGTDSVQNDTVARLLQKIQRYRSVGMVGANSRFTYPYDPKDTKLTDTLVTILPLSMTDGINEKGVYIGVNVAPAGETSQNSENWHPGVWGNGAAYTQKEKLIEQKRDTTENAMCVTYLTRIVLNYAETVDDAIEIVGKLNWFEPYEYKYFEGKTDPVRVCQAFHWLICDNSKSVVLEFIDNKPKTQYANDIRDIGLGSVMTNFSNCIYDPLHQTMVQHGGSGYERYNTIIDYYKNLKNKDSFDMVELMHKFHYSKFYHEYYDEVNQQNNNPELANYKYRSEFAMPYNGLPAESLYPFLSSQVTKTFCDSLKSICEGWPSNMPACEIRQDTTKHYWYSTHTSIYDLNNHSFKVLIHEGMDELDYDKKDLNKLYYDASLDDPGNVKRVKNQ